MSNYGIARFRIMCAGYKETCYPVVYAKEIRVSSEIQYMGRAYNDNFRLGNCCEKVPQAGGCFLISRPEFTMKHVRRQASRQPRKLHITHSQIPIPEMSHIYVRDGTGRREQKWGI